jgi:N-methylhydantoinase B/oxoprolinase/acetone carboxylase alpha subunit
MFSSPLFRWCYLSNAGHWPDTGGMVPGGFSATATEIVNSPYTRRQALSL